MTIELDIPCDVQARVDECSDHVSPNGTARPPSFSASRSRSAHRVAGRMAAVPELPGCVSRCDVSPTAP